MSDPGVVTDSEPYARFLRTFFEAPQRDGPDMHVLDQLTATERDRAEQHMIEQLPDSLTAMNGLSHLGSVRALAPLREVMHRDRGSGGVHAAIAVWEIAEDAEALQQLCRRVRDRPRLRRPIERVYAAAALTDIDRRDAVTALIAALDDPDRTVAAHAAGTVGERLRLRADVDAWASGHLSLSALRRHAQAALADRYPAS